MINISNRGAYRDIIPEPHFRDPVLSLDKLLDDFARMTLFVHRSEGRILSGGDVDKFATTGLTPRQARRVRPPIIQECLAHLECRVVQDIEAGDHRLVVAEVLAAYAQPEAVGGDGLYDLGRAHPLLHLGRNRFTSTQAQPIEPTLPKS